MICLPPRDTSPHQDSTSTAHSGTSPPAQPPPPPQTRETQFHSAPTPLKRPMLTPERGPRPRVSAKARFMNRMEYNEPPSPPFWSATQTRAIYGGLCGIPSCGQAVKCGVCNTPELWRGAAGLCARARACAGAAESLHTDIQRTCICTILLSTILYGVWYTQGGSVGGRILRNARAIVLQSGRLCRWGGGIKRRIESHNKALK